MVTELSAYQLDIIVLCGGAGRRMQGADKPLMKAGSARLIDYTLASLPATQRILVSANRNLSAYQELGHEVVVDLSPGMGPLGGVVSCLSKLNAEYVFVVPGDATLLPQGLVSCLFAALQIHNQPAVVCRTRERIHYLPLLVRRAALADPDHGLAVYLATHSRSVKGWLNRIGYAQWSPTVPTHALVNINTPEELAAISRRLPDLPQSQS